MRVVAFLLKHLPHLTSWMSRIVSMLQGRTSKPGKCLVRAGTGRSIRKDYDQYRINDMI